MVRQLANCVPTPLAGRGADAAAYVMIVIDTVGGEVDAYGPTTLAQATSEMGVLRAELDADGAEFDGVAIKILQLLCTTRRRNWS